MSKRKASQGIRDILMSGYGHYSREEERMKFNAILLHPDLDHIPQFETYENALLANQPLRSLKNNMICGVAIFCRHAADLGADDQRCYALSDYYIREIEDMPDSHKLHESMPLLGFEMIQGFAALVAEGQQKNYSLPINRTIRYIHQHLYDKFNVSDIAQAIDVHPNYLSSKFKKEVGTSLCKYIRNKKMEEAKSLLQDTNHSIAEISEMLGYSNVSHFAYVFRQVYNYAPHELSLYVMIQTE